MARRNFEELRLLSKVSKLYYEEGFTQSEIVKKLSLSPSKISRLIQQAKDVGIVRISVLPPPGIYSDLEVKLEQKYNLLEAIVVEVDDPSNTEILTRELGTVVADYFLNTIRNGDIVGITWGTSLHRMVEALQPTEDKNIHIVQILGGLGPPESEVHATEICRQIAQLLNCQITLLNTPGIVKDIKVKEVLLSDPYVKRVFDLFPRINLALVGIGVPTPDSVVMRDGTILTKSELDQMLALGAQGDIALRFFDNFGVPIRGDLDERVIGMTLDELKNIERVVGIAGGPQKLNAIKSALVGGLVNILVTDQVSAMQLLDGGSSPGQKTRKSEMEYRHG
jgi:DNA-binding transcriptional regulator LsrR (DeoR family)